LKTPTMQAATNATLALVLAAISLSVCVSSESSESPGAEELGSSVPDPSYKNKSNFLWEDVPSVRVAPMRLATRVEAAMEIGKGIWKVKAVSVDKMDWAARDRWIC